MNNDPEMKWLLKVGGFIILLLFCILTIKENFPEAKTALRTILPAAFKTEINPASPKNLKADPELTVLSNKELSASAIPKTAEEIYQEANFTVKIMIVTNSSVGNLFAGSGIVVQSSVYGPCVLTAAHILQEGKEVKDIKIHFKNGLPSQEAEIIGQSQHYDAMLLRIKSSNFLPLTFAKIGKAADLNPGAPLMAIGSSLGGDFWCSAVGFLYTKSGSPVYAVAQLVQEYKWPTVMVLGINAFAGYSGGPILNKYGEVVGITVGRFPAESQLISIALPIEDVIADFKNGLTP